MKTFLKKSFALTLLLCSLMPSIFAIESEPKNCFFEIILKLDSEPKKSGVFLKEKVLNPNNITALQEILKDQPDFAKAVCKQSDINKAKKFHSKMGVADIELVSSIACGNDAIVFFKSKSSTLRPDMNFLYFKNIDGKLLWDVSAKSPYTAVLSESVNHNAISNCADESKLLKFVDISDKNNENIAEFSFYKNAQKDFYDLKLDEYGKVMTLKSLDIFKNQYLKISKDEQKEALKDYITYHKSFKKMADLGAVKVILFVRERDNKINSYDAAFIICSKDGFKLANFGQNQGAFADWLLSLIKEK